MPEATPPTPTRPAWSTVGEALALVSSGPILRRSIIVALVVGTLLSVINQLGVITAGSATGATWVRIAANYAIPFVVSSIGALSVLKSAEPGELPTPAGDSD
jgi:hypothetical protein